MGESFFEEDVDQTHGDLATGKSNERLKKSWTSSIMSDAEYGRRTETLDRPRRELRRVKRRTKATDKNKEKSDDSFTLYLMEDQSISSMSEGEVTATGRVDEYRLRLRESLSRRKSKRADKAKSSRSSKEEEEEADGAEKLGREVSDQRSLDGYDLAVPHDSEVLAMRVERLGRDKRMSLSSSRSEHKTSRRGSRHEKQRRSKSAGRAVRTSRSGGSPKPKVPSATRGRSVRGEALLPKSPRSSDTENMESRDKHGNLERSKVIDKLEGVTSSALPSPSIHLVRQASRSMSSSGGSDGDPEKERKQKKKSKRRSSSRPRRESSLSPKKSTSLSPKKNRSLTPKRSSGVDNIDRLTQSQHEPRTDRYSRWDDDDESRTLSVKSLVDTDRRIDFRNRLLQENGFHFPDLHLSIKGGKAFYEGHY